MKKKIFIYILLCLALTISLFGCVDDKVKNDDDTCKHEFVDVSVIESSCTVRRVKCTCVVCGNVEEKTEDPVVPHDYVKGSCSSCGAPNGHLLDYTLSDDGSFFIVSGSGKCPDDYIIIPSEHDGLPVKVIGAKAFYTRRTLKTVEIPEGITAIESEAFYHCEELMNVVIPDTVELIGDKAFYSCRTLTVITVPPSVKSIGEWAFYDCRALKTVKLNEGIEKIGNNSFRLCSQLWRANIPGSLKVIETGLFYGCPCLIDVTIEKGVQSIEALAFSGCENLIKIAIPSSVVRIGREAFSNTRLEEISFANGLEYIEAAAFKKALIKNTIFPDSLKEIGEEAFAGCFFQSELILPVNLETIGARAFENVKDVCFVKIHASIKSIGEGAFSGCRMLETVEVDEDNMMYKSIDGNLYTKDGKTIISYSVGQPDETFDLPDTVENIPASAFSYIDRLAVINLGANVKEIDTKAFNSCVSVREINVDESNQTYKSQDGILYTKDGKTLVRYPLGKEEGAFTVPDGVEHIGDYAFYKCTVITRIDFPQGLLSVGKSAFGFLMKISYYVFPDGFTTIGEGAFEQNYYPYVVIPKSIGDVVQGVGLTSIQIFFKGTKKEWIMLGMDSKFPTYDSLAVSYYSEDKPLTNGDFWHFNEDGLPVRWY